MEHSLRAKIWVGEEQEGEGDEKKLFVDDASFSEIKEALDEHPEVSEVYFGHTFRDEVVKELENRIKVTLEVKSLDDVPEDLKGRVNIILRVPSFVDACKKVEGSSVSVASLADAEVNDWNCKKAYKDDEVLLYH